MFLIDNVVVDDALVMEDFACKLSACKGACCVAGDGGAPLEDAELDILPEVYPAVAPYLSAEGKAVIRLQGHHVLEADGEPATPLVQGGACAYAVFENGVAVCGIEKAYLDGKIGYRKPISCQLYPIRIVHKQGFDYLQYHRWDICRPACVNGKRKGIPVYVFLKDALIRKYGEEFYAQLSFLAQNHGR